MGFVIRSLMAAVIVAVVVPCAFAYSGGDGTAGNPYQIASVADFMQLSATSTHWSKAFILTADIILDPNNTPAHVFTQAPIAPDIDSATSGFQGTKFTGIFDGNGHTISNFTYSTTAATSYIGLFGCFDGRLTNLKMTNVSINAPNANYVGAITGYLGAWVLGCGVESGSVRGYNYVGGISGYINMVSNRAPAIYRSYAKCSLTGNECVGGIAGYTKSVAIKECYSNCPITVSYYAGGIFGKKDTTSLTLENCYATGTISGFNRGGLLGDGTANSIRSFWDQQTTNCITSGAGEPKTTAQMKTAATYIGWGCTGMWTINEGIDYPRLSFESMPGTPIAAPTYGGGSGTQADPYLIYTAGQFNDIGKHECHNSAYFKLMDDIVLDPATANNFSPIGYYKGFNGSFDGNYHVIYNPYYVRADTAMYMSGIFTQVGVLSTAGEVKNLGIVNPNFSSAGIATGGLCGYLYKGTIQNCFIRGGHIQGVDYTGGLTGSMSDAASQIRNCYTNTAVSGDGAIGGLAGASSGIIEFCYTAGPVSGTESVGGLIGSFSGGQVNNCFYDQDTTGLSSGQGTALSTAAMKMTASYVNWDFVNTWAICEGTNYPRLQWQIPAADWVCPDGVRMEDFGYLAGHWMETTPNGDLSGDGVVGIEDLILFCDNWMLGL